MKIISRSDKQTIAIGKIIAKYLKPSDVICLFGQLGSGKTTLTKGIAEGLGIPKNNVVSPSFVLIREHAKARLPLYHFDLYRLKGTQCILDLGYEEYLYAKGVSVIEWADKLGLLMPQEFLKVELTLKNDSSRSLKFEAKGEHYKGLLNKIHENISH